jgi:hypothetical protein
LFLLSRDGVPNETKSSRQAHRHQTCIQPGLHPDFALVWQEEGLQAVRKVARKSPESFVAIAAKVCAADVRVSIEPSAGGFQVVQAVKAALPDAAERNPTEVFQFVLGALRQADAKTINGK